MDLSFGVNVGWGADFRPVEAARNAEAAGFDVVTVADHVGAPSPFVALAAAAAVTERVRLRTYVLDYGFWNPGLLARDVATLDAISGGRVELGIGAGHMRHEHEAVGLPFPPYRERMAALADFADEVTRRLADPGLRPRPVQEQVPLLLASMSPTGLDVAARHAAIVGISGALQVPGARAGTFTIATSGQTDERVGQVVRLRQELGLLPAVLDVLLQQVVVDREPEEVAAEWEAEEAGRISAAAVLDTPFVLLAESPQAAAEELVRRSQRWGITSWCTHAPSGPALAQVIRALRG